VLAISMYNAKRVLRRVTKLRIDGRNGRHDITSPCWSRELNDSSLFASLIVPTSFVIIFCWSKLFLVFCRSLIVVADSNG